MKKFPVTIVDDFYENPDLVRNYALSLDYQTSPDGSWPGYRTEQLSEINPKFFKTFNNKIFSLFYNFESDQVNWQVDTTFQSVTSFSSDKNDIKNDGWIHSDSSIVSGVIYLNPNPKPNWGTSIYKLKPGEVLDTVQASKYLHYSGSEKFDEHEHRIEKKYSNNKFVESIRVENVYNRLILFDGNVYHGVPSFYSDDSEPRLTQVFFIENITSSSLFPIVRSKVFASDDL